MTLTALFADRRHSRQYAFDRDVINPHDGHILCDPYSATGAFGLRIFWRNGIANSATSRPKEILVEVHHDVPFQTRGAM